MNHFEAMSILVAVADGGSLSEASRKLKVPLASVSRKVSELETHLKVKLMNRSTRKLEFTDSGLTYVTLCRRILDDIQEAERSVTGEYTAPKGLLTVTAPIAFGKLHMVPIISEFLKAFRDVDIRLVLSDRNVDLFEEKIDLALRIGDLANSSLIAKRVGQIRQVICASPEYLKKQGRPTSLVDLKRHDCISITSMGSSKSWSFSKGKTKMTVAIHSRLEVSTPEAGVDAAARGAGIVRALSYQIAAHHKEGSLDLILENFESGTWPVHLIYSPGRIIPLKLRAFLDFATPRLRKELEKSL